MTSQGDRSRRNALPGKHHRHGSPLAGSQPQRVRRVVPGGVIIQPLTVSHDARDLHVDRQRIAQHELQRLLRSWGSMMTAAPVDDPAAAAMLSHAAAAARELAAMRGACLDIIAAFPLDAGTALQRSRIAADVMQLDRAARRVLTIAAMLGR